MRQSLSLAISFIVSPVGISLVLTSLALAHVLRRRLGEATALLLSSIALLLIGSMPITRDLIFRTLERRLIRYEDVLTLRELRDLRDRFREDAYLVLLNGGAGENLLGCTLSESTLRRVMVAIEAEEILRAPMIITGGEVSGRCARELIVKLRPELGELITLTEPTTNTIQDALAVREMLNGKRLRVILVTSAYHLPRAMRTFRSVLREDEIYGLISDLRGAERSDCEALKCLIPSTEALEDVSLFTREMVGNMYYLLYLRGDVK